MLSDAFFVGGALHERPVQLPDGTEQRIHFRELPWADWYSYQTAMRSEDVEEKKAAIAQLLSASICDPSGAQAMTSERARQLRAEPMHNLLEAVLAVHGKLSAEAKKTSPSGTSTGSGMSSPSPSAAPLESSSAA